MPRLRERIPVSTELVTPKPEPHRFKPGHKRIAGREKGTPNVVTRTIREGIIEGLNRAGGPGGVADYVCRVALEDPKLGVQMMSLVVPRQAHVEVTRNEQALLTVEQLDASLIASGLPPTKEIFALDFARGPIEEAEVLEPAPEKITK